jgi:hypothetical protein
LIVSFNQLNSETGCCPNDSSKLTYNFKGLPSVAPPFTISSLKYRINEKDYDVEDYKSLGIILGGKSDGSQFCNSGTRHSRDRLRDLRFE